MTTPDVAIMTTMRRMMVAVVAVVAALPIMSGLGSDDGAGVSAQDSVVDEWWDARWGYRLGLDVGAAGFDRTDAVVSVPVDFSAAFGELGVERTLDPVSIRVVEVDAAGAVVDGAVPFQFDPADGFDAGSNAVGVLWLELTGTTPANGGRGFDVYFDVVGSDLPAAVVAPRVTATDGVEHNGLATIEVSTESGTYFYDTAGAGFASVIDTAGNDWVSWSDASGSAGEYRGIPNMVYPEGHFHPGNGGSSTSLVSSGPLAATFRSTTDDGLWSVEWSVTPDRARMRVLDADGAYWFLYEGTPGGVLEPVSDIVVTADGTTDVASESWSGDLVGAEWVSFGDPAVGRSLYVANHQDDAAIDSYRPMRGEMTVFGFGRDGLKSGLDHVPGVYSFGLVDATAHGDVAPVVERNTTPVTATITGVEVAPSGFSVSSSVVGAGYVVLDPAGGSYADGAEVEVLAVPAAGWEFVGWSGDVSGSANPESLTVDGDKSVTATFEESAPPTTAPPTTAPPTTAPPTTAPPTTAPPTTPPPTNEAPTPAPPSTTTVPATKLPPAETFQVSSLVVGAGSVVLDPAGGSYADGAEVEVLAVPADGWELVGWSGDVSGSVNPESLTVDGDKSVTATFEESQRSSPPPTPPDDEVVFDGIVPERLVDTRIGQGGAVLSDDGVIELGVGVDPVALNLTAVQPSGPGYFVVFPCADGAGSTSSLNWGSSESAVANMVLAMPDQDGRVCIKSVLPAGGHVDVVVDRTGSLYAAGGFAGQAPERLRDSREEGGKLAAGSEMRVTGLTPGAGAILNLTVDQADGAGYLTAYPCAAQRPTASVSNYRPGLARANSTVVKADDVGAVCIYTHASTHLIVDHFGTISQEFAEFITPSRLLDSREQVGRQAAYNVTIPDVDGRAAILNVTAASPSESGYATVYPCGGSVPTASTVNFAAGQVVPNHVLIAPDADGQVCIATVGNPHILIDLAGYLNQHDPMAR